MTFAQASAYLLSTIDETASRREPYRLDRMRAFLRELGDPQDAYPTVHVGGTSGKGSTSTMAASILTASGKKTGLHTKPHLRSMVERARIGGVAVSEERFAELLAEMMPAIARTAHAHGRPSYYETLLALAFLHFARERVDVAVIEVGIGGKLDGTNVLRPRVSIITNVGLDHTEILGDTLEKIAADKAGIAKAGVPLVSAVEDAGPREVIEHACARAGAPFISVLDRTQVSAARVEPKYAQRFTLTTPRGAYDVRLPLLGQFQQRNAATAVLALEQLDADLRPQQADVEGGLARVSLVGRMEYFPSRPGVVFDVAHNPDKAAHLAQSLPQAFPGRRFRFVVAIGESKDAQGILRAFAPVAESMVFTTFTAAGRVPVSPDELLEIARALGAHGVAVRDPLEAFVAARAAASNDDVIVVTGSTFVVAELRQCTEHVAAERSAN
ncbi:MAG TPA: folylpolyglutamate synthase/dihydrofolate synthase family protein [Candidatus Baltobacteraceae bacterium]|nr:folylpolyglutamate synthase/dihydrofolate synthase family protein [Candidatus Baltobacteraceae bacterium]